MSDQGEVYWVQGDFDRALEFHDRAIQIAEKIKNTRILATSIGGRGLIYWHQGNLQKALEDFNHCTTLFEQLGSQGSLAINYLNLGSVQMESSIRGFAVSGSFKTDRSSSAFGC